MKELPILFNTDMVKAILDGRKTQTRRPIKLQPKVDGKKVSWDGKLFGKETTFTETIEKYLSKCCPFGEPGDRLWVREAFGKHIRNVGGTPHESVAYKATDPRIPSCYDCNGNELPMQWIEPHKMPHWACRLFLEVTNIRIERVQDITEEDAWAEGCEGYDDDVTGGQSGYSEFMNLWDSIYAESEEKSVIANPWVWVIEFKIAELKTVQQEE